MESIIIENNLDKECSALGGLFQQIITEMKNGVPNFDEFISKAGKLHSTLRSTILVFGSFLDSFQKIADSASNTKGTTRDIGTCLTRIVIRHRALESRMKSFAGALMDCLVLPIQGKLEEWKKVAVILDKEHSKTYKKNRSQIKKKFDQVVRLRKKLKKEKGGMPDPSVQRLFDQCSKDLNSNFRTFEKTERSAVRRILLEDHNRFCTFVAFLKPVLNEELSMLTEIQQIENIMEKLNRTASLEESTDLIIEDFVNAKVNNSTEDTSSLYLATPPSTPYMGSRNSSMNSLVSDSTANNSSVGINYIGASPHRRSIQSEIDYEEFSKEQNPSRPNSSLSHQNHSFSYQNRPHTISSSFNQRTSRTPISASTFKDNLGNSGSTNDLQRIPSPSLLNQYSTYSTIKRTNHSPLPRTYDTNSLGKRPPLPTRGSSTTKSKTYEVKNVRLSNTSPDHSHYATPKSTYNLQMVPNFISDNQDMVIPHPVYVNCKNLQSMKISSSPLHKSKNNIPRVLDPGSPQFESFILDEAGEEEDLKTPTVEELSFNEKQEGTTTTTSKEDGSGSSSDSFGSSSGYGSQYIIRLDEHSKNDAKCSSNSSPSHNHTESLPKTTTTLLNSQCGIPCIIRNNSNPLQDQYLSPSHSFLPQCKTPLSSRKPPPPIRRSSIEDNVSVDDDPTPRGSFENLSPILRTPNGGGSNGRSTTSNETQLITSFEKDGTIKRFYEKGEKKTKSLDECNYIQSPGLRSNLESLNSFFHRTSDIKKTPLLSTDQSYPRNIKVEIESAFKSNEIQERRGGYHIRPLIRRRKKYINPDNLIM
ncbi:MTSS1 [Lepeophtheirus salmonis]|uniref:MTSS1 n=1 Tax=Lepeophtheirus salmonis TaxID=72036 RepID=A0A7R8H9R8_LEPSM|nr:MTSS1 [Lepeophtheirus salmonis]CAF2954037.1 MTSS1 [Lepeophtheirus salmonis]